MRKIKFETNDWGCLKWEVPLWPITLDDMRLYHKFLNGIYSENLVGFIPTKENYEED